ncbi:protein kinase [bacterium]|nr:protein kinase [bacterium]
MTRYLYISLLGVRLLFWAGLTAVCPAQSPLPQDFIQWKNDGYDLGNANEALARDFNLDGRLEVLLSDQLGNVVMVDAATGRKIWSRQLEGGPLLGPIYGQFLALWPPEVVFLHQDGRIPVLNAGSGDPRADTALSANGSTRFALVPMILPAPRMDLTDRMLAVTDQHELVNFDIRPRDMSLDAWAGLSISRLGEHPTATPAVGLFARPEGKELPGAVFISTAGQVIFLDLAHPTRSPSVNPTRFDSKSVVALVESTEGSVQEIVVCDHLGNIRFYAMDFSHAPAVFDPRHDGYIRTNCPPRGFLPIVADLNADGTADFILTSTSGVVVVDGASRRIPDGGVYSIVRQFITPPALIQGTLDGEERSILILADDAGLLHLLDPLAGADGGNMLLDRISLGEPLSSSTPLVLSVNGDGKACILVQKRRGVALLKTNLKIGPYSLAWPASAGSKLRNGGRSVWLDEHYKKRGEAYHAILANLLATARTSLEEGDYEKATEATEKILSVSANHREAADIHSRAFRLANRAHLLYAAGASVLILAALLYLFARTMAIRSILKKTRDLADLGQADRIVAVFERFFRQRRGPLRVIEHMGALLREHGLCADGLKPVLERGHRLRPENENITIALAWVYMEADNLDREAQTVYQKAKAISDEPASFDLALGRMALAEGELAEARGYLESAYQGGNRDPLLYDSLARVYAKLDLLIPRHLPVFETASHRHPEATWLLEALAKSYIKARLQQTPKARQTFEQLAEANPHSSLARQELAAAWYREGQFDKARETARKTLEIEPENAVGLQVLAWCAWRERDVSDEARDVYFRASERYPGDTQLLQVVARFLLNEPELQDYPPSLQELLDTAGAPIETAGERILRAIRSSAGDPEFLALAAQAGMRWRQSLVTRHALEALRLERELTDQQILALAKAYLSQPEEGNPIPEVLLSASILEPEMTGLDELLGQILIRQRLYQAEHLQVFERLCARADEPVDRVCYGLHLARILEGLGRYSAMAEVLAGVQKSVESLAESIENRNEWATETQRLLAIAHSNLQDFHRAVRHYESLLEGSPDDPEALVGLGQTYARMDNHTPEMYEVIHRARELAPNDPYLCFASGVEATEGGQWSEAEHYLLLTLKTGGEFQDLVLNQIQSFIRRSPGADSIPARWLRAHALLTLRRYEDLPEETETICALNPKEKPRVLALYERVLQSEPRNVIALCERARILHRQDVNSQARALLEDALKIQSDYRPAQRLLLEVYETMILRQTENVALRFDMGQLAMRLGEYDKAVPCFQKTRLETGYEKQSTRLLAECFYHKNMYELALQEFQHLSIERSSLPMLYRIGREFETQGNMMAARMAYQRVYATDANYEDISDRLHNITQSSDAALSGATLNLSKSRPEERKKTSLRYDLRDEVGRGAMATVFRAFDNELEEIVALKILPENFLGNEEALRRFRLEARSARHLTHENIVRIHDIGEEQGRKYISMEYIDGLTLKKIIQSKNMTVTPALFLHVARKIAGGMAYAHSLGVVHRDLKPANIMITRKGECPLEEGVVKITDFGIAKIADHAGHTMTGALVGTPLYMSPEQVIGRECDHRADIYSYGVLLYEMAAGSPPFKDGDLAYHHLHTRPEPLQNVHGDLGAIIIKCLEKDPARRYSSFQEILDALQKIGENSVFTAPSPKPAKGAGA